MSHESQICVRPTDDCSSREAIPLPNAKTEPTSINEAQSTAAEKVEPSTNKEAQDVSINEPDPLPEEEIEPPHVDEAMSPTSDDEVAQQLTGSQTRLKEQSSVSDSDGQETVTSTSTTDRKRKRKGEVSTTSSKKHQKASSGQSPLAVVPTVTAQSATSITDDALAKALGRKSLPRERPLPLSALYFPSNAQAVQAVRSGSTPPDLQKAVQMSDLRQTGQGIQPSSPSTWNTARFAPSQIIDLCSDSSDESPSPPSPPDTTQEQAISNTNTKSLADAPTRIGLDQSERKTPGLDDAASNMSVAPRKEPRKPRPTLYPPSYYARNRTSSQQPAEGTVIHELAITQSMPTDRTSDSVVRVKQEGATSTHAERTGSADDQPHITVSVANVVAEAIDERAGDTAVGKIADLPRNGKEQDLYTDLLLLLTPAYQSLPNVPSPLP